MKNELTINGETYSFNFGFGFMRDMNKTIKTPVQGLNGVTKEVGLKYVIAELMDGELEALIRILDAANKGQEPRLKRSTLEEYIEDEDTNIDELFSTVMDFLRKANCCKKTVEELEELEKKTKK